ncbi:MAG: hypothetical protein HY875_10350 [Chloroflexi bacterium]|nr:hypothetical protein [Chloroflexota bacterium]
MDPFMRETALHRAYTAIVLLTIGCFAVAGISNQVRQPASVPARSFSEQKVVTEEDAAWAVAVLNESPLLDRITGGQALRLAGSMAGVLDWPERPISVAVSWDLPVTSSGPWIWTECQGTRTVRAEWSWKGLTGVAADVERSTGRIVSLSPYNYVYTAHGEPPTPAGMPAESPPPHRPCVQGLGDHND